MGPVQPSLKGGTADAQNLTGLARVKALRTPLLQARTENLFRRLSGVAIAKKKAGRTSQYKMITPVTTADGNPHFGSRQPSLQSANNLVNSIR